MTPKSEHHVDLTLEKSPSGTWTAPEAPKRTLKPWQRLWIVSGIVYLLMLAGTYYLLVPVKERYERQMVAAVIEEVRRYDGMAFAGESPRKIFESAHSAGYGQWVKQLRSRYRIGTEGNAGFDKIEKTYREEISALPFKQLLGAVICIVAWMVPMALFYGIGAVVEWIRSGPSRHLRAKRP